ncbi:helicase-related protein [Jhaorihella thermophila]
MIDAEGEKCTNAIIFCNRKVDVDIVAKSLSKYGYDAAAIHGDLDQSHRMRTLEDFREGKLRFLVASDVAARGLDVPSVSHVFNFDVPTHPEDYVHRIGRTGRAGREGKALTICAPQDEKYLEAIERLVQKEIPRLEKSGQTRAREEEKKSAERRDEAAEKPIADAADDTVAAPREADEAATSDKGRKSASRSSTKARASEKATSGDKVKSSARGRKDQDLGRSGNKVVGMGDHLPRFIALSFDERRAG